MQDIIRKTLGDELPDFYNIVLERPKDDPTGYDVLFIDAASKVGLHPPLHHLKAFQGQLCCSGLCMFLLRHIIALASRIRPSVTLVF